MTLIDDTCDKCGRRFDPMGDPLLTKHPEVGPYAVFCETCERRTGDNKALNLAELRRVAEAATEGPWVNAEQTHDEWFGIQSPYFALGSVVNGADADFIATARNEWDALLDRLEAAEAKVDHWREAAVKFSDDYHVELNRRITAEAKVARVESLLRCPFIHAGENAVWVDEIDAALRGDA